jgi:hypothetical protein
MTNDNRHITLLLHIIVLVVSAGLISMISYDMLRNISASSEKWSDTA